MWMSVKLGIQSATRMRIVKTQTARTHANVALVTMVMGIRVETSMSVKQDLFAPPRQCAKILQAHSHAPARKVTMVMGKYAKVIIYRYSL